MSSDEQTEVERVRALERLNVLDAPAEACFLELLELATTVCDAPKASISLITRDRRWSLAKTGLSIGEAPRAVSICQHVLHSDDLLVIENTVEDARSAGSPLVVGPESVRFYAGAPLIVSSGHIIGALCIYDVQPRPGGLTPSQAQMLRVLAAQVVAQMELRQAIREQSQFAEEQRRAREALALSEERHRLVGEATHDMLWVLDVATEKLEGFGRVRELLGNRPPRSFNDYIARVHPDDLAAYAESYFAAFKGPQTTWSAEYRMLRDDGTWRWCECRARFVRDEDGWTVRVYGALLDVTPKVRLREQMVQNARQASVGVLAGGVAHEMNNPLAYVLSNLNWLREDLRPPQCSEDQRAAIDDAIHGAERLRRIIADLQTFAQEGNDALGPVDLETAMRAAVTLTRAQLRDKAVLTEELVPVPMVWANLPKLTQSLVNVLQNAAQAVQQQKGPSRITLRTGREADGRVVVEVQDDGVGMSEDVRLRAVEPFYTTRPIGGGLGLGLSVCHGLVKQMEGELEIQSAPGQGTRVRILLKASGSPHPSPGTDAPATGEGEAP